MLNKRAVLLSKDEVTYNTDSVPVAGTDAILVEDMKWAFANTRMEERKPVRAQLGALKPIYAGTLMSITFAAEMKGSGAAGTPPELAPCFRGAGMSETIVASTSVTYKPSSLQANHKSQSIYFYDDGLLFKVTGALGKVTFDFSVGKKAMASFEFLGHFVSATDVALPTATYDSTVPVPLINVPFTVDAYAAVINKLTFDLGMEVGVPESISAVDGYGQLQFTGRKVTGSINPDRVLVATHNFISKFQTGAAMALTTGVIGATAGNRLRVDMPAITYTGIDRGAQGGDVGTFENKFAAVDSTGDDEVSVIFT